MRSTTLRGLVTAAALCLGVGQAAAQTSTTTLSTNAQNVLALAEELYPTLFKGGTGQQTFQGYVYRFYSGSGIYVGFKDDRVYLMGGAFGPGITDKGPVTAVQALLQDVKAKLPVTGKAAGASWTQLAPLSTFSTCNSAFNAVANGAGTWVAVGNSGCVRTSTNGVDWSAGSQPFTGFNLFDMTFANGRFVAVGSNGNAMVSTNGSAWTRATQTTHATNLNAVLWTGTRFLAVGEVSAIPNFGFNLYSSTDGLSWTAAKTTSDPAASASRLRLTGIAGNGNTLVAVGGATLNCVAWRSTDAGDTWSFVGSATCGTTTGNSDGGFQLGSGIGEDSAKSVAFGNGKFVAVGALGSWATSTDGVKWTTGSIDAASFPLVRINRVHFDGTQFIAVGNQKRIYTSTDGATWTKRNADTTLSQALSRGNFYGIGGSAGDRLITVGDLSSGGSGVMTSVP